MPTAMPMLARRRRQKARLALCFRCSADIKLVQCGRVSPVPCARGLSDSAQGRPRLALQREKRCHVGKLSDYVVDVRRSELPVNHAGGNSVAYICSILTLLG